MFTSLLSYLSFLSFSSFILRFFTLNCDTNRNFFVKNEGCEWKRWNIWVDKTWAEGKKRKKVTSFPDTSKINAISTAIHLAFNLPRFTRYHSSVMLDFFFNDFQRVIKFKNTFKVGGRKKRSKKRPVKKNEETFVLRKVK